MSHCVFVLASGVRLQGLFVTYVMFRVLVYALFFTYVMPGVSVQKVSSTCAMSGMSLSVAHATYLKCLALSYQAFVKSIIKWSV